MHVIWKRPDGYLSASPQDFRVVEIGKSGRLWLHRTDREWFPFQVSGGWQDAESTQRLNQLVNLFGIDDKDGLLILNKLLDHSRVEDLKNFIEEEINWIATLKPSLKGDTWEVEILANVFDELTKKLKIFAAKV